MTSISSGRQKNIKNEDRMNLSLNKIKTYKGHLETSRHFLGNIRCSIAKSTCNIQLHWIEMEVYSIVSPCETALFPLKSYQAEFASQTCELKYNYDNIYRFTGQLKSR